MKAEDFKISKLSYIENGGNEIMKKYQIRTQYETEPPHGDAIFSISIKGKVLPFWMYGRDITFIGSSMVMVESVKCKTWNPIETVIIDLEDKVYANLQEWYVNDTLRMYKNDDIRMYNFNCITDTIVEVITTCNTYTLLTVHLL